MLLHSHEVKEMVYETLLPTVSTYLCNAWLCYRHDCESLGETKILGLKDFCLELFQSASSRTNSVLCVADEFLISFVNDNMQFHVIELITVLLLLFQD